MSPDLIRDIAGVFLAVLVVSAVWLARKERG